MWTTRSEELTSSHGLRFTVDLDSRPAAFADVLRAWQSDAGFRSWYNSLLAAVPLTAFRWETPPVTSDTLMQPFEFVLLDSPGLAESADLQAFAGHFRSAKAGIVVFPNLGRFSVPLHFLVTRSRIGCPEFALGCPAKTTSWHPALPGFPMPVSDLSWQPLSDDTQLPPRAS